MGNITGRYGADGLTGGEALTKGLDELASGVKSDIRSERGLEARLRYLTSSPEGYQAMEREGISGQRNLIRWLSGDHEPSKENAEKLDRAYLKFRRQRMNASLKRRLAAGGAGTRIEIYPLDQGSVDGKRRRSLAMRHINLRPSRWDAIVDAWSDGDMHHLDDIWIEIIQEGIGSDWQAYTVVEHIGFSA